MTGHKYNRIYLQQQIVTWFENRILTSKNSFFQVSMFLSRIENFVFILFVLHRERSMDLFFTSILRRKGSFLGPRHNSRRICIKNNFRVTVASIFLETEQNLFIVIPNVNLRGTLNQSYYIISILNWPIWNSTSVFYM